MDKDDTASQKEKKNLNKAICPSSSSLKKNPNIETTKMLKA